jgi:hypothetical protein
MSDPIDDDLDIAWPERMSEGELALRRPLAFAELYATLRAVRPSIATWEADGIRFVLDRLSMFSGADAARIGRSDEPWHAVGVTKGLR